MLATASAWLPATLTELGWLFFTIVAYLAARLLYQRSGAHPLLIPVLTAVITIIVALVLTDTPYDTYAQSTRLVQFLIGPATVALAIPLYNQLQQLKRMWLPLSIALFAGGITAIVSTVLIAWLLGGSLQTLISVAPKSATMPIAIPASVAIGGIAPLIAIGLTAHAIGTARALQVDQKAGASAALAMGLNSLLTAAAIPFLPWFLSLFV